MVSDQMDIVIYGEGAAVLAGLQVQNSEGLDRSLATALVRDEAGDAARAGARFLGIVSQDRAFLWDLRRRKRLEEADAWELPMEAYLRPYLAAGGVSGRLRHTELELLVFNWLSDLLYGEAKADGDPQSPLVASGFLGAIRGPQRRLSMKTAA